MISQRGQLRVVQGKGEKDRMVLLTATLIARLRDYWRAYRPRTWLFPSALFPDRALHPSAPQKAFTQAKRLAGVEATADADTAASDSAPTYTCPHCRQPTLRVIGTLIPRCFLHGRPANHRTQRYRT